MGRRRGQTGAGGAVVSSLSGNSGGTVRSRNGGKGKKKVVDDEPGVDIVFESAPSKRKPRHVDKAGSASDAQSVSSGSSSRAVDSASATRPVVPQSAGWIGKTPVIFLQEWCAKHDRFRPRFANLAGPRGKDGTMQCIVPKGRKSNPAKTVPQIIGIGEKPGEQYAALNALHQVERGKPLQQLLAPEFRDVWLDMDKRFSEAEAAKAKAAFQAEKKRRAAERKAKAAKNAESATISISSASRHAIEDAILENSASSTATPVETADEIVVPSTHSRTDPLPVEGSHADSSNAGKVAVIKSELVKFGFTELDAQSASVRFRTLEEALDFLCLNLDESELPPAFAPMADVEVVQFYKSEISVSGSRVNAKDAQVLAECLCASRYSAERALRSSNGDSLSALKRLFQSLTLELNELSSTGVAEEAEARSMADEEKAVEVHALKAIYGSDVNTGVGLLDAFPTTWSAVVKFSDGLPALGCKEAVQVCVVDTDGLYPLSCPVTFIQVHERSLSRARRRAVMRAAASEIRSLRQGCPTDELTATPVVHSVASFLRESTESELLAAASDARPAFREALSKSSLVDSQAHMRRIADSKQHPHQHSSRHRTAPAQHARRSRPSPLRSPPSRNAKQEAEFLAICQKRKCLPAHKLRQEILAAVRRNKVTVVSGATGSGKTTQVPQFLLEEAGESKEPISIVCTQPRRIAAISVAERVAAERCEKIGDTVGYQVKLHTKRSESTRLTFCTTGVLLRQMQSDPLLESHTHILVDECHERSVETDFVMLLAREILPRRSDLRLVLMSATIDATKFAAYFEISSSQHAPGAVRSSRQAVDVLSIPGRTFPVTELYLEDAVRDSGYRIKPGDKFAKKSYSRKLPTEYPYRSATFERSVQSASESAKQDDPVAEVPDDWESDKDGDAEDSSGPPDADAASRGVPVAPLRDDSKEFGEMVKLIDESIVNMDLIDALVRHLDRSTSDESVGAVLIFLPGMAEISTLVERLSRGPGASRLFAMPLHSALSPDEQAAVFSKPPKGKRKVICSTNIAETSVTVEDVTIVIDTTRVKEMTYDEVNGTSVLAETFISRAAARQRAGRAGRVSRGICYRLVRQATFDNKLAAQQEPEIRRVSLEHLVLNLLSIVPDKMGRGSVSDGGSSGHDRNPHEFLSKALDPPSGESITAAVRNLIFIGALVRTDGKHDSDALSLKNDSKIGIHVRLTSLGKHLTGLPVDARIGKMLIYGAMFGCLDAALTVAATLSERSPFFSPRDRRDEAREARDKFKWGRSDLLLYVKTYNAWREVRNARVGFRGEMEFCERHFLSRKTLLAIGDARRHLENGLSDAGFHVAGLTSDESGRNVRVIKAVLCAALYPNVIRIDPPETKFRGIASGSVAKAWSAKELKLRVKSGERVFLHPESVNFSEGDYDSRWLAYFSKVRTTRVFVRDSTMVSPYAILLFGGDIEVRHAQEQLAVDGWVVFKSPARVAVLVRELRRGLDDILRRKFDDPGVDMRQEGRAVHDAILHLIQNES